MWLYTDFGFFSVVKNEYCKEDELVVRCRSMDDFHRLREHCRDIEIEIPEVKEFPKAKYRFRVYMKARDVAAIVQESILDIRYDNFQNVCAGAYSDPDREKALHKIWSATQKHWR